MIGQRIGRNLETRYPKSLVKKIFKEEVTYNVKFFLETKEVRTKKSSLDLESRHH